MYFDAVLNRAYEPLFNGTPEETRSYLQRNENDVESQDERLVAIGRTLEVVSVSEYLARK